MKKNANINIKNVINNNLYCTFNEWIFFEIYISDYDLMYNEVMLMLYEFLYKLKLKYFYINYMDNSENTLRLRIYKCIDIFKIVNFIQKKLKLYFVIKPYIREVNKYGKSIYNDIEKHFVYESQSILDCLSEYNFNNKVEICINFIDTIIEKLNLNLEEILTFFRQYKYLDIEYDINIKKEIQIYLNKNKYFIQYKRIKFYRNKIKLLNEFIHLLCNRIFGIDPIMELKIKGICKKIYLERIYKNEKNRLFKD